MRKSEIRSKMLIGAALFALCAQPAFANDSTDGESAAAKNSDDDIVVTAQFREASAQDTAMSLEVISSEALSDAGVTQATDLSRIAPGVQLTQGGTALQRRLVVEVGTGLLQVAAAGGQRRSGNQQAGRERREAGHEILSHASSPVPVPAWSCRAWSTAAS